MLSIREQAIDRALVRAGIVTAQDAEQYGSDSAELCRGDVDRRRLLDEDDSFVAGAIVGSCDGYADNGELWAAFNRGWDAYLAS